MLTNMSILTLFDMASTPINHVFTPIRSESGIPTWVDREHNGGVAIGYARVTYSCREPAKVGGVFRHNLAMNEPFVDFTIPAKPVLGGVARATTTFLFPDMMSDQQRKDFVKKYSTLLNQDSATALGDNIATQTEPY